MLFKYAFKIDIMSSDWLTTIAIQRASAVPVKNNANPTARATTLATIDKTIHCLHFFTKRFANFTSFATALQSPLGTIATQSASTLSSIPANIILFFASILSDETKRSASASSSLETYVAYDTDKKNQSYVDFDFGPSFLFTIYKYELNKCCKKIIENVIIH